MEPKNHFIMVMVDTDIHIIPDIHFTVHGTITHTTITPPGPHIFIHRIGGN
jgi:hypothetical protein